VGKKKDRIRIRFIGENSEDVTGSETLIEMPDYQLLLECGLYQSSDAKKDYKTNSKRLDYRPSDIDYIFLNHLHIDHSGKICRLYANGCKARIIAPKGSVDLFKAMCVDSAYIIGKDVEMLARKYGVNAAPIYTEEDVNKTLEYFDEYDFEKTIKLNDSISFRFVPSGHIINSAQLELWLADGNHTSKILYTSDLGNASVKKYYSNTFTPVDHANVVIGECTYGDATRSANMKDHEKDLEKIKSIIETACVQDRHRVLIPIFALDRAQNILTYLYDLFGKDKSFNIPILIDSPLTIQITKLYSNLLEGESLEKFEEVLRWENIKFVKEYEESQSWRSKKDPCVCLSASGFMQAGRSKQWAKALLPDAKNHIIFVGYSSSDSLAGRIKNGKIHKTISIDGKPIPNRCGITNLLSFSSHCQHDGLLSYYSNINAEKICLVHGEMKGKISFAKELQEEISRKNRTSKVVVVNKSCEILL